MLEPGRIHAENLGRKFKIAATGGRSLRATLLRYEQAKPREFWALRNVDLDIEPGETFGIVGRNGSGKSTLLKMLARIFGPTEGSCETGGRISSLLELGAGFHQEFSAIENIYLSAAIYGIPREEIDRELDEIIGFAELEDFAHQPVKTFSSGMFARLGFSVAMHVRPDVLLLDEVLAVGDEPFVQKCMGRIAEFRRMGGTMVLVTHDAATVERMCSRALFLEKGHAVMTGSAHEVITTYHEHLAAEDTQAAQGRAQSEAKAVLDVDVEIHDSSGTPRHRFTEGEPVRISLTIRASSPVAGTRVAVTLRDELSREIGTQFVDGIDFRRDEARTLVLDLPRTPLRDGQFQVDAWIIDLETQAVYVEAPAAESIAILGQSRGAGGPVQLDGVWTVA